MNPVDIIRKFYDPASKTYKILLTHSRLVAKKAKNTAQILSHLDPDTDFIVEAAMLHDIGIFKTNAPELGCTGRHPYVCQGYLGRKLLESIGLPKHALVCERHIGVGITVEDIISQNLPLPKHDMVPVSLEEKIICFADKFFSKSNTASVKEMPVEGIIQNLKQFGHDKALKFQSWVEIVSRAAGTN